MTHNEMALFGTTSVIFGPANNEGCLGDFKWVAPFNLHLDVLEKKNDQDGTYIPIIVDPDGRSRVAVKAHSSS